MRRSLKFSQKHETSVTGIAAALVLAAAPPRAREDVSLTIRFAGGSNHFKVGEVVRLELIFWTTVSGKYKLNTAGYDRSGRLEMERFDMTPKGRDPLYEYYHDSLSGVLEMGGLYSIMPLDKSPQTRHRNLHEWVAIDRPGRYSLRVMSPRVETGGLTSNVLAFDVVDADPRWQQATLSRSVAVLGDPTASAKARESAEETLRFLDSPASVRELVRQLTRLGGGATWNFTAGLLGAHDQDLVLKELETRFAAPDAALTNDYIWLLGRMQFTRSHTPLPAYPTNDPAKQKDWQARQEQLGAELNQLYAADSR